MVVWIWDGYKCISCSPCDHVADCKLWLLPLPSITGEYPTSHHQLGKEKTSKLEWWLLLSIYCFFFFNWHIIYNIVMTSAIYQQESAISIYICPTFYFSHCVHKSVSHVTSRVFICNLHRKNWKSCLLQLFRDWTFPFFLKQSNIVNLYK